MGLSKTGLLTFEDECDLCGHTINTEEEDWHAALKAAKASGFKVFNDKGDWLHFCGQECLDKYKKSRK